MLIDHIKQSDREPEEDGSYLAIVKSDAEFFRDAFITHMLFLNGQWLQRTGYCTVRVLAWKPLHSSNLKPAESF